MKRVMIFSIVSCFLFLVSSVAHAQSVDILWQGETYTPPFYEGRSLWSKQSRIIFLAIPQSVGNPNTLSYRWIRNGTVLGSLSGSGQNTLTLTDTILSKTQTIGVEITATADYESPILARASVTVTPVSPVLSVYENSPLYGLMFHREVGSNYILREPEVTFDAFPLFFSTPDRGGSDIAYSWRTNAGEAGDSPSATYRAPEDGKGFALISVEAKSAQNILQSAKKSFSVEFGPIRD